MAVKLFAVACPLLPLTSQRSLASLSGASFIVIICVIFLVAVVCGLR